MQFPYDRDLFRSGIAKRPHHIVAFLVEQSAHDEDTRRAKQIQKTGRRADKRDAREIRGDDVCRRQHRRPQVLDHEGHVTKPVLAYIAGFSAPPGKTMGHAGAIISGSSGTAAAKKEALESVGIQVGTTPTEVAQLVADRYATRT